MSDPEPPREEVPPIKTGWWSRFPIWARIGAPIVLVLVAVIVIAVIPRSFTVNGIMEIVGTAGDAYSPEEGDNNCSGAVGYQDIAGGTTQVIVTDGSGTTVAVGHLATGRVIADGCAFKFKVQGVPAGKSFYKVEVGHRGAIQYTEKQMRDGIGLSLG
jgi:hypothetical protein